MKKSIDTKMLDVGHILLAKVAKDHVNAYRYLNWQIEPEVLLLIIHKGLWRRWGYNHLFLALRREAGLSAEAAKLFSDYADEEEKKKNA